MRELRDYGLEMYVNGFTKGGEYMRDRIHNSVTALDYGGSYYVAPTVEPDVIPEPDLADADTGVAGWSPSGGTDPEAGAFPSS
jgi:hypothetical protein